MAIPDISITIKDNALGLGASAGDANKAQLKIGIASAGTVRTIYAFQGAAAIQSLYDTFGDGPLTEAAALALAIGGGPVYCMRATTTTAGSCGSVSHSGTGTAVFAVSGAAYDSYDVKIKIVTAAANLAAAAAQFQYSLDGGLTYSATIAVPTGGSYAIPNTNVTVTITDGTFVKDDIYSFTTTAPAFNSTELTACVNAALAATYEWGLVHVVGPASSAAGAESLVASLDSLLSTAATAFRYTAGLVEFPTDTDANLLAAATGTSNRVMRAGGFANVVSPMNGRQMSRSVGWDAAARFSQVVPSEDLGRVATGSCPGVTAISRDERVTPGLGAKFVTMRTFISKGGFYLTEGRMAASPTSDFTLLQNRRVMDIACTVGYQTLLNYINSSVRVDSGGKILEKDARAIEAAVKGALGAALLAPDTSDGIGYASAVDVTVDRTANILSTQTLPVTIRVTPRGYAKQITVNIGFSNPALTVAAA